MTDERTMLEIIAPTVEEAIDKGLSELGLKQEDVEVEILDEGKRNIFKISSRQARIKLIVKRSNQQQPVPSFQDKVETYSQAEGMEQQNRFEDQDMQTDETLDLVKSTVSRLLVKMNVDAEVDVSFAETTTHNTNPIRVNLEGDDLSYLIGHRSETINALQYITSLMIGNQLNQWTPVLIDVQDYRLRRERELQKMAGSIAEQVIQSGRKQYLEPMPANERRIIHMELRKFPEIKTESVGEEPYRKVTVSLIK